MRYRIKRPIGRWPTRRSTKLTRRSRTGSSKCLRQPFAARTDLSRGRAQRYRGIPASPLRIRILLRRFAMLRHQARLLHARIWRIDFFELDVEFPAISVIEKERHRLPRLQRQLTDGELVCRRPYFIVWMPDLSGLANTIAK